MLNFLSFLGLLAAVGGGWAAFTHSISPTLGIYLILGGILWMAFLCIPSIFSAMKWGRRGLPAFALYIGLLALAGAGGLGYQYYTNPINDLTTNATKPPSFLRPVYLFQPKKGAEFLDKNFEINRDYPNEFAGIQNTHYSGFETITAKVPLADAQPVIDRAIKEQFPDWKIVHSEKTYPHIEAEVEDPYLHSVTDIVVEGRATKNNIAVTMVDFRSHTRFPYGDFGLSATRMTKIRNALTPALEQAANKYAEFQKNYAKPVAAVAAESGKEATPATSSAPDAPAAKAPAPESTPAPAKKAEPAAAKSRLTGKLPSIEE
ncbi:MAG: DUF1499 domain-containing protein [Bdellovibrionota bacterium]